MARPKRFHDRTTLAFAERTFAAASAVLGPDEDRADLIRSGVELEIALRQSAAYQELKVLLLANETVVDFCLRAVARAVAQRKAALGSEADLFPEPRGS